MTKKQIRKMIDAYLDRADTEALARCLKAVKREVSKFDKKKQTTFALNCKGILFDQLF